MQRLSAELFALLQDGIVIPAHPLALTADRRFDERSQAALTRYYVAAGAGGVAVGVHSTQFEIHDPKVGLLEPVLALAAEIIASELAAQPRPFLKIAGVIGKTAQALGEAQLAADLGYDAILVSLAAFRQENDAAMLDHCRQLAACLPVVGFYLQPAVGGRLLGYNFWLQFAKIENVVAIKIAPFNRYQTLDVVRAVVESGRSGEIALYTGNDDNIVVDLLTQFDFGNSKPPARIVGGLLGQWAVGTRAAVEMLGKVKEIRHSGAAIDPTWLTYASQMTDVNAALFDAANNFQGCLPGISYLLAQQGLVQGHWTLNPHEVLAAGQAELIERVRRAYPALLDDEFVASGRERWLR